MPVEIRVPTINGITLNTKNKYVKEDINVTVGIPKYDYSNSENVMYTGLSQSQIDALKNIKLVLDDNGDFVIEYDENLLDINFLVEDGELIIDSNEEIEFVIDRNLELEAIYNG